MTSARRVLTALGLALVVGGCGGSQAAQPTPLPAAVTCNQPAYQQPPWDQGMSPPPQPVSQGDLPSGCHDPEN